MDHKKSDSKTFTCLADPKEDWEETWYTFISRQLLFKLFLNSYCFFSLIQCRVIDVNYTYKKWSYFFSFLLQLFINNSMSNFSFTALLYLLLYIFTYRLNSCSSYPLYIPPPSSPNLLMSVPQHLLVNHLHKYTRNTCIICLPIPPSFPPTSQTLILHLHPSSAALPSVS